MQVSQPMLQLLLYKKAQNEQAKAQEANVENNTTLANNVVCTSSTPTSEDYKTADAFATRNCNRTTIAQEICNNERILSSNSITISDLSEAEIRQIKQRIYNIYHKTSTPGGNGGSGSIPGDSTPTTPSTPVTTPTIPTTPGTGNISFMKDFSNVDEMFNYINTIAPSVSKSTGLSDNQLWELTQRDDWEENNNNFFGKLNESFNFIDTDGNHVLSYDEICCFIGDEMGLSEYNELVNQYSDYLQSLFETMTPDEKLAFSIEKAREYLSSIGLTKQVAALERLEKENKLGFVDLNPGKTFVEGKGGWTLGSYAFATDINGYWDNDDDSYRDLNGDGYDDATGIHYSDCNLYIDENEDGLDDITNKTWGQYANDLLNKIDPDGDGFDAAGNSINIYFDFYNHNNDSLDDYHGGIFLDKFYYTQRANTQWYDLVATMVHELTHATASFYPSQETKWGEYVAYQTEEDYLDSIAHGQWSGAFEENNITTHINTYYDPIRKEPVPTFDWTSYGTYA